MTATRTMSSSHYSIAAKLARGYERCRFNNPHTPGVLASGVTVTLLSAPPVDLGKIYAASTIPTISHLTGGTPYSVFGVAWGVAATTFQNGGNQGNFGNGTSGVAWRLKVNVDADSVCFQVVQTATPAGYRVLVDGKYVSLTPIVATNGGFGNYIRVDFGTPPAGRSKHEVWLEGDGSASIAAIYTAPNGSVQPAPTGLIATVLGDSITVGYINTGTLGLLPAINDNFSVVLADAFGITDVRSSGMTGEGFVATGSGPYTLIQRVAYDVTGNEDVIFVEMGTNDIGVTQSLVTPAVTAGLQAIRAKNPKALIIVGGVPPTDSGLSSAQTTEANYLTGFTAWGDSNSIFVPYANPPSGQPEIYGTYNIGNPASGTLTFTGALVAATSGTLTSPFTGPTNSYFLNFGDNVTQKVVTLTNGSTAVSWTGAVTETATVTYYNGSSSGNADYLLGYDGIHPSGAYAHMVRGFWHADAIYNLLKGLN